MKPVEFHPEARAELEAAVDYYEQCAPGLGVDLRKEVEVAVEPVVEPRPRRGDTRQFRPVPIHRSASDDLPEALLPRAESVILA